MGRAVYLATLTGPVGHETGRAALKLARTTSAEHPEIDTILDDHAFCYPAADPATVLQPLEPDRLAEAFLALTTPGHSYDTGFDHWATPEVIERLLIGDGSAPPTWAPRAVTMLVETAREARHIATGVLNPILSRHPHLAIRAGGATLSRLAEIPDIDLAVLEALEQHLPDGPTVNTDVAAAAISTRLISDRIHRATDPSQKAALHLRHAQRMYAVGSHQSALAAARAAQRIYLELPPGDVASCLPAVLNTRTFLSLILSELGEREQALEMSEQVVIAMARLAAVEPGLRPDYARVLSNHSCRLAECDQPDLGLRYAQEAVTILDALRDPRHNETLAHALSNLSVRQHELQMYPQALQTVRRSVYLLKHLLEDDRARYLPAYGIAVTNLTVHYANAGNADEAARQAQKAVDIYRELAQAIPEKYLPELAKGMRNLAIAQMDGGRLGDAIECAEESVELYRGLTADRPFAFRGDLALSLATHGRACERAKRDLPHARAVITEAIGYLEELTAKSPVLYADKLAEARHVRDALGREHVTEVAPQRSPTR
jgi:tetratricopeptide (TPR) repeat protein